MSQTLHADNFCGPNSRRIGPRELPFVILRAGRIAPHRLGWPRVAPLGLRAVPLSEDLSNMQHPVRPPTPGLPGRPNAGDSSVSPLRSRFLLRTVLGVGLAL